MAQSRFLQASHLKIAFLLSLLVIFFLLTSFFLFSSGNIALTGLVQKVNVFLSWPDNFLESITDVSLPWFLAALWIQMFWFCVFYLILLIFTFFGPGE